MKYLIIFLLFIFLCLEIIIYLVGIFFPVDRILGFISHLVLPFINLLQLYYQYLIFQNKHRINIAAHNINRLNVAEPNVVEPNISGPNIAENNAAEHNKTGLDVAEHNFAGPNFAEFNIPYPNRA